MIVDASNILYRTFFAHKQEDEDDIIGLAHHIGLTTLNKYFKKIKPHKVVLCFDRPSWRKTYTKSDECVSKMPYKGNRRQQMTPSEKKKFEQFMDHIKEFEEIMRTHSSIICLTSEGCEADDLISMFVQMNAEDDNEFIIISGDKDFIQLLGYPGTTLVDPASGKQRTLDEWNGDHKLFMYEKCFRGDRGDNVMSSYPRLRKKRIMEGYKDDFKHLELMADSWTLGDKEFSVKELFKENELLMDLRCQPMNIKRRMVSDIVREMREPGEFSYFHFIKFLSKNKLDKIKQQAEYFIPLLSR